MLQSTHIHITYLSQMISLYLIIHKELNRNPLHLTDFLRASPIACMIIAEATSQWSLFYLCIIIFRLNLGSHCIRCESFIKASSHQEGLSKIHVSHNLKHLLHESGDAFINCNPPPTNNKIKNANKLSRVQNSVYIIFTLYSIFIRVLLPSNNS